MVYIDSSAMGSTAQQQRNDFPPDAGVTPPSSSAALLRWRLLKRSLLTSHKGSEDNEELRKVSRRPAGGYNLVPSRVVSPVEDGIVEGFTGGAGRRTSDDMVVEYLLPGAVSLKLITRQRCDRDTTLHDLAVCREHSIDNTGIVCLWPAEEVLTYFCGRHPDMFRHKRVIELGSGYGLGGLAIAACTEAAEVVITDGNPQVVDYIQRNITANGCAFGNTMVSGSVLRWSRELTPCAGESFDLVVAADCTFFRDFHVDLVHTIKSLLESSKDSQAILFNPRRGSTLDLFVHAAESLGLSVMIKEHYDAQVWEIHQLLERDHTGWPNYDADHCYPLLLSMTL